MPEIKHTFAGARMNKDVDERSLPPCEYRDALNIDVDYSDGSDIGALKNILGNIILPKTALLKLFFFKFVFLLLKLDK